MNLRWLSLAISGAVLAALIHGGVYQIVRVHEGAVYRLNRFTGSVHVCAPEIGCRSVERMAQEQRESRQRLEERRKALEEARKAAREVPALTLEELDQLVREARPGEARPVR